MLYYDLNSTNQIGGFLSCSVNAKKKQIQKTKILYMYNVTKLNLFADAPVRQSGNSVNAHELLIMALFNFAL